MQGNCSAAIDPLIRLIEPRPVLIDVGASAEVPPIWRHLARHSIYVGFDPDLREMRSENGGQFYAAYILNEAVVADAPIRNNVGFIDTSAATPPAQVTFNLTRAPQCSSTLWPNQAVLENYVGAEQFEVVRQSTVPATTLDHATRRLGLRGPDWLKLDTQGTDLRLFNSLSGTMRWRVLAVDAEPGLRGAYEEEDLFGDLHAEMIRQGFWCAAATIKGRPRVRPSTLAALVAGFVDGRDPVAAPTSSQWDGICPADAAKGLPTSPGWVECRYLRTAESLTAGPYEARDYVLLWAFATAAGQPGYAGDLAMQYGRRFGPDRYWQQMSAITAKQLREGWAKYHAAQVRRQSLVARFRSRVRKVMDRLKPPLGVYR